MKTISLRKKVSAVAVASLGFGLLSVVPASANVSAVTYTAAATNTPNNGTAAAPIAAGTAIVANLTAATTTTGANGNNGSVTYAVTAGPASVDITSTCTFTVGTAPANATLSLNATTKAFTLSATGALAAATHTLGQVSCPTTFGGTYTITPTGTFTGAAALSGGNLVNTALALNVSGLNVSVGTSRSTTAGTANTNGAAAVIFTHPTRGSSTATAYRIQSSGVGNITSASGAANTTATTVSGVATDFSSGIISTTAADNTLSALTLNLSSSVAGVQTITASTTDASTGVRTVIATATVTWGDLPAVSPSLSTSFICAGAQTTCAGPDATIVVSNAPVTAAANANAAIKVTVRDANGTDLSSTQVLSVSISGPGNLALSTNQNNVAAAGRSLIGAAGNNMIAVFADGNSGVSTITISVGSTVIATERVTFFGAVKTLTVKQNHTIASTAGAALGDGSAAPAGTSIATTPAVVITARDENNVVVPSLTITALSSDTSVMSNTITVTADDGTKGAGAGTYNVQVNSVANTSGKTATLTFRVMSGTTVLAASAPVPYRLGGAVASVALSLDKASYTPGAPAIATLTLRDSLGNAAFDGDHANILSANLDSTLTVVKALAFSATANAASSLGGVASVTFNAPGTAATAWTISGTTGTGPATATEKNKAISAAAAITDANQAAVLTQIAALNARVVALNALIAKIMKRLNIR